MKLKLEKFYGVFTALVTPFKKNQIDFNALETLVDYQLRSGIDGLVALGTTGECATLDDKERTQIIECILQKVNKRVPVLVGTGSNCTRKAVAYTQEAHRLGVDGMLVIAPYYNRPNQAGLFLHFSEIAEATDKPILLYSIPARCGVEIGVDTLEQLRGVYKNIIGIKEAGGSCNRVSQIIKNLDENFVVLSGDDSLTLPFVALGAKGVVSAASNWAVQPLVEMVRKALDNNLEEAAHINRKYYPFFRILSLEPNPVPIKQVLYKAGLINTPDVRLPLCPMSTQNVDMVNECFNALQ